MDTAISGGDFAVGANGLPRLVSGREEILQRAYILLRVPVGSFCYEKELGSEIPLLEQDGEFTLRAAEAAQEALRDLAGVTVSGVQADFSGQSAVGTVALETDLYGSLEVVLELPKEDASGDV